MVLFLKSFNTITLFLRLSLRQQKCLLKALEKIDADDQSDLTESSFTLTVSISVLTCTV